jgi:Uracil DNA glycosylase superfamily
MPDFKRAYLSRLLTPWADRGVLLLNACLTVRAHKANSHANQGWEQFTSEVLRVVSKSSNGVVFMAWGTPAQKRVDSISVDKTKNCVLKSVHPSPLSAARGWFECKHFIKANEWLRERYGVEGEVEWDCLAEEKRNKGLPTPLNTGASDKSIEAPPATESTGQKIPAKDSGKTDSTAGDEDDFFGDLDEEALRDLP